MTFPDKTLTEGSARSTEAGDSSMHGIPSQPQREAARQAVGGAALLTANELVCSFGGAVAVDHASFSLAEGKVTALIGPNGAGKSTALKILSGAVRPSAGEVHFAGLDVTGWPPYRLARVGLIRTFQIASVFGRLTTIENLLIAAPRQRGDSFLGAVRSRRYWARDERTRIERAWKLLGDLGLADKGNKYADELSGGQRRLLELARSLMAEPKLLLLDEPTTGVSPPTVNVMIHYLKDLQERGMTILVVEHQFEIARQLADDVIVMVQGKVIARGDPDTIEENSEVREAYVLG